MEAGGVTLCGCVFVHKLQGKVTTAQVDTRTVYIKSTRVPVSPVPQYGYSVQKSCFERLDLHCTTLRIIKTYDPYTKILNFVLFIWEERNSDCYEHARACRERARAPRVPKQIHEPSKDIIMQYSSTICTTSATCTRRNRRAWGLRGYFGGRCCLTTGATTYH
jgi:hypothetical protein